MPEVNTNSDSTSPIDDAESADGSIPHKKQTVESGEQLRLLIDRVFCKLAELKIAKVTVGFNGFFGSSVTEYILTERTEESIGIAIDKVEFEGRTLYGAIGRLVHGYLDLAHPGWQDDKGSGGTCTLNVGSRKVQEKFDTGVISISNDSPEDDKKRKKRLRYSLFNRLSELGIAKVIVKCEGGGDGGHIVSATPTMEPDRTAPFLRESEFEGKPIWDAIEEVVLNQLSSDHYGWEINTGSDATYLLNVARRKVTCKFFQACAEIDLEEADDDHADDDDNNDDGDPDVDNEE